LVLPAGLASSEVDESAAVDVELKAGQMLVVDMFTTLPLKPCCSRLLRSKSSKPRRSTFKPARGCTPKSANQYRRATKMDDEIMTPKFGFRAH
jgi:hypothetical protein